MIAEIDLAPIDEVVVTGILRAHLPADATVWVFGSRAKGRARRGSDLDLAVDAGRPLTWEEKSALAVAFEDSDLPWRVDVVDWRTIQPTFGKIIEKDRRPYSFAEPVE